jgi:1-acyl-sn-glycerol-3-phosphate acyltransferase
MAYGDRALRIGKVWMGWPIRGWGRVRGYGAGRMPTTGGLVVASNHMHWMDVPVVGAMAPRPINFVAKIEVHRVPGLGQYIRWHGALAVRRDETDRDAVRMMRQAARDGRAVGLFVEGTRMKTGRPGPAMPGAAMISIQEEVPIVPTAVYGTQFWKPWNFAPCSVAYGEPVLFDGLPKNGKGYREATAELERRINTLFDWLADVHKQGRPKGLVPPL